MINSRNDIGAGLVPAKRTNPIANAIGASDFSLPKEYKT